MIFRVNKNKNYTVISNYHLKDKNLSLKAKGLLSQMLSLPEEWNYSIPGLVAINKEKETSIKTTLDELKLNKYLIVTKLYPNQTKSGRYEYIYDIYEYPKQEVEKQDLEILGVENLGIENLGLNKVLNNKILKNKIKNIYIKPTLEEVQEYCKERKNNVDPKKFYDYYEVNDWIDNKGNKVKNWKQKLITWEKHNTEDNSKTPDWFNEDIKEVHDIKKEEELKDLLKEFKDEINN